jgi:DNA repair exonuclease SbcCD ATPase subunit
MTTDRYKSRASTHADGCWSWGHGHYECAVREIKALQAEVERLRTDLMESDEIREKLRHLLTRTAAALKGEPPAGVWHSWHDLPEKVAQLADALEALKAENERLRDEVERLRTDGASAVRWAPGSAYWSDVLRELFGPHARDGIDVLETRWQAALERAERLAEMLRELEEREQSDEAMLRQALEALESADWYIGQLEWIVYSPDDTGTHEERAKVQSAITALRERLGEGAEP